jgi:hypothetical protein
MLKIVALLILFIGCLNLKRIYAEDSSTPHDSKGVILKSADVRTKQAPQIDAIFDRGVFIKEGRRYRRFESAFGSIFVLDSSKLSQHDIERAQCVPGMAPGTSEVSEPAMVGTESTISEKNDWKAYSALIQKTIKSRCDGSVQMQVPMNPHLDLGISHSIKDKNGDSSEIKVFNRDLQPNLNFEMHF